jgi:cell division transport system permease protein
MHSLTLFRIIKSGWHNFRRNGWLSLATVSIIFLAIFTMTSLILTNVIIGDVLANLQNKVDVSVYLKQETGQADIANIQADLASLKEVKSVGFVSSAEALATFKEKHKDNQALMDSLKELGNPLLPTINIEAQNASQYEGIINFLEQGKYNKIIDKINYQQNKSLIDRLFSFSNSIKRGGLILGIILSIIAILVTFNTVRLAMYNFREEIGVKRLVGASDWYIRGPFLVEGMLYGAIAAVVTLIIFFPVLLFLSPKLANFVPGSNILEWFTSHLFSIFLFQLVMGIILGGVSSLVAIRKYLRV